jgi:hypothetical protein
MLCQLNVIDGLGLIFTSISKTVIIIFIVIVYIIILSRVPMPTSLRPSVSVVFLLKFLVVILSP